MQDDNTNVEVTEEVVADESQPAEEQQQDQSAPEEQEQQEEAQEEQEEGEEQAPEQPSRREQLRIQQLLEKYGNPDDRKPAAPSRKDQLNYQEALDADEEVINRLEADRNAVGDSRYNEGLARAEYLNWNTQLKIAAPQVESQYPVLNPRDKENFNPAVADAVNRWYVNMAGYNPQTQTVANPNVDYAEFVDGFMELVQETAGRQAARETKNIAKQAATTGLRPDGSSAKALDLDKAPGEMTMEELYAAIGQKAPKK